MTSNRDITIYPRVISGEPKIEVYEADMNEKIVEFESLISNKYNKVYLSELEGSQDVFDLRIINGSVEFDHIIDPGGFTGCVPDDAICTNTCGNVFNSNPTGWGASGGACISGDYTVEGTSLSEIAT